MTPSSLKTWRITHGWTQREACEVFGVKLSTWQKWEGRTNPVPGIAAIAFKLYDLTHTNIS